RYSRHLILICAFSQPFFRAIPLRKARPRENPADRGTGMVRAFFKRTKSSLWEFLRVNDPFTHARRIRISGRLQMTASGSDTIFSKPRYRTVASPQPARRRLVVAQDAACAVPLLDHPLSQLLSLGGELAADFPHERFVNPAALYLRLQLLL